MLAVWSDSVSDLRRTQNREIFGELVVKWAHIHSLYQLVYVDVCVLLIVHLDA